MKAGIAFLKIKISKMLLEPIEFFGYELKKLIIKIHS